MQKTYIQITSGRGPEECCRVVVLVMEKLMQQASSFIQEMEGPSLPHIYEEEDVIDDFVRALNNTQVQVIGP